MKSMRDRGFALPTAEVTPRAVYEQRRHWLALLAAGGARAAKKSETGIRDDKVHAVPFPARKPWRSPRPTRT